MTDDKKPKTLTGMERMKQIKMAKKTANKKSVNSTSKIVSYLLSRFGLIIMTTITLCGLIYIVIVLNTITEQPYANNSTSSNPGSSSSGGELITVDPTITNEFNSLKQSASNTNQELPSGRINPFTE